MARIGIMGGTFNPIHNGHLMLGRQALEEYGLDQVWFMPSGQPPHKKGYSITCSEYRCEMVRLAIEGIPGFVCSDFEVTRPGITYSADTLKLLHEEYPEHKFYFIIGADSFYEIEQWYHPWEVMELAVLMVAAREYDHQHNSMEEQAKLLKEKYHAEVVFLHCQQMDVSSSEIRALAGNGSPIETFVPAAVADFIRVHELYQS